AGAEAVESGAKLLLMDEDTCAANFMVRDPLMQRIVSQEQEPIVPYSRTMRPLFENLGVSTILVAGSSGAFFRKADTVIQMDRYQPKDVTAKVREVLKETGERSEDLDGAADPDCAMDPAHAGDRNVAEDQENAAKCAPAFPDASVFSKRVPEKAKDLSDRNGRIKRKNLGQDGFMIGRSMVDLRAVEQIADWEQTECLSLLSVLCLNRMDGKKTLSEIISGIWDEVQEKGFSALSKSTLPGNLALPRKQEFYAALNRMRDVRMRAFSA
ncbi:MAG: ABC-ATPase domain-containing protein, partial [Eubacteriales bacterium]|nr:ABC-ATPase domain-containing protein [Eubacteriales bacterium]